MEVIRRRNKRGNRCFENWESYDDSARMQNIEKVGCKAPYHFISDEISPCGTQQELKDSAISMRMVYDLPPPCHEISYFTYRIHIRKDKKYGDFQISVNYPPWTKIITQSQAIGIHALIGNIGGYIGLFVDAATSKESFRVITGMNLNRSTLVIRAITLLKWNHRLTKKSLK